MRTSVSFVRLSRRAAVLLLVLFVAMVAYSQITPSQDAYTNSASPATNYGVAVTLGAVNSTASIQTTYIQFDLSSIPAGYKSSNIAKATLKLYVNTVVTAGSFNIDFVNGTWTEKKITSNLAPALGAPIVSSVPLTSANVKDYVLVDVTAAVGAWLDGTQPNDGIALVANSPLSATFDSKENTAQSQPPEIDIVYAGIAGVATASGSGLTGGGTSSTLNLSLTNACAANQILQWTGTAWVCANFGAGGTVSSVGLTAPSTDFIVTGSPVTASGTLGLGWMVAPDWHNTPNAIVKRDSSGNFSAGTINAASGFNIGSNPFAFGSYSGGNAFLGFAGNATMTGTYNIASGATALFSNSTGSFNSASGDSALYGNTTGSYNTASGVGALSGNTTGGSNTASGSSSLAVNTIGTQNTADGTQALFSNTTGSYNSASGESALYSNTSGSYNTALGANAGPDPNSPNLIFATAIGANAVVSESNALVLGGTGSNAVKVGIGTATPQYALDVRGTGNFAGLVRFASGQTFPGTGTITGVTAGTDFTGGGTSGNVTLNLDTTKVPQLAANNTFTGAQTINNNVVITAAGTTLTTSGGVTGVSGTGSITGVSGTGSGYGVYGASSKSYGVYGSGNIGIWGIGNSSGVVASDGIGVYGDAGSTGTTAAGVYGTSTNGQGVFGDTQNGFGVEGWGNSTTLSIGVFGHSPNLAVFASGNFGASGTKSAVVALPDDRVVSLYAMESPENWFEDFGSGKLNDGVATIEIEATFAQTVNTGAEYHVFLTPKGDCKGLYVTNESATGFEVRELSGGQSSVTFDYRIVAKRKGLESLRLEDVQADHETAEAIRQQIAARPMHTPRLKLAKIPQQAGVPEQPKW